MLLKNLAEKLEVKNIDGDASVEVGNVVYDSRKAGPGSMFAAVRGLAVDGRRFIPAAIEAGATAVLVDEPLDQNPGVPVVLVENARGAMALAASILLGKPAEKMVMIGITGTNGKTTTTYLLESMLKAAGKVPGVVGTVNFRFPGKVLPAPNTTPEGPDLQSVLAGMVDAGVTHAVMEVSSHALDLRRVDGCTFDAALFTNLTQDHLDYHEDLESYYRAKKKLFTRYLTGSHLKGGPRPVFNLDDAWGQRLSDEIGPGALTFSLDGPSDVYALRRTMSRTGMKARIQTPAGEFDVDTGLLGDINLSNALAAVSIGVALGLSLDAMAKGLDGNRGAPGRLERVGENDDFLALVDYAHSPDALSRALKVVRNLKPSRLISVAGCGGDRDRTKRPIMGKAAGELSDLAILTSDNPRTEDPVSILEMMEAGLKGWISAGRNRANWTILLNPGHTLSKSTAGRPSGWRLD